MPRINWKLWLLILCSCSMFSNSIKFKPERMFEGDYLPIANAIFNSDEKELEELLKDSKININSTGKGGENGKPTFLLYAITLENPKMMEVLLKNGANPNKASELKPKHPPKLPEYQFSLYTPLCYATKNIKSFKVSKKVIDVLVKYNVDLDYYEQNEYSALANAIMYHEGDELFYYLLKKGANINGYSNSTSGNTPLMFASVRKWDLILEMLNKGANPTKRAFNGWDFMKDVHMALEEYAGTPEHKNKIRKIKDYLVENYNMEYPPVRDEERGEQIKDSVYQAMGWEK